MTRREKLLQLHSTLSTKAAILMKTKNADYSHGDDPYANFRSSQSLGISPILGILLRMNDKMMRIRTFVEKGSLYNESVEDSIIDLINYSVLIAGILSEEESKEEKK